MPTPTTGSAALSHGTVPTIVLVGHGMVGQRFLEALAERGLTATHRVVVLCEEPRPAYDRVHLTSYFSGTTPDELSMTDLEFIEKHGIELHLGDPAGSVDREARTVTARSGLTVAYDTLVLATGSYPFVPPVPGKDADGCFVYRTIEDLLAIEAVSYTHLDVYKRQGRRRAPPPARWSAAACSAWRPPAPSRASDSTPTSWSSRPG